MAAVRRPEEKKLVLEILDLQRRQQCYRELPLFEKEWGEYHKVPFAKTH